MRDAFLDKQRERPASELQGRANHHPDGERGWLRLNAVLAKCPASGRTVIDCAGCNPFDPEDVVCQCGLIEGLDVEVVWVLAAGGDPMDAVEQAVAYADMGVRRLLVTRLDIARRLGGMLAAADAGRMSFAEVGIGLDVAGGLAPLNAVSLARLLLPEHGAAQVVAAE